MKKPVLKLLALLLFGSVAMQSCSVEYRENKRKRDEQRMHDRDHGNNHDHDEHYRNY
jgi:hypothetical protein